MGNLLGLLAILIMLLVLLIMLGLGVYYIFNQDKINSWLLGDSADNYKGIFKLKS